MWNRWNAQKISKSSKEPSEKPLQLCRDEIKPMSTIPLIAVFIIFITALTLAWMTRARAETIDNPVKVIGKTADGKYKIYDIIGELNDLNYRTSGNIIYNPDDLPNRMAFISPKDANKGTYKCGFICKDKQGHVVGLNPAYAALYGKPIPK